MKDVNLKVLRREFRRRTFGCHIEYRPVCPSTNDVAFQLAEERYPEGTIVLSDAQTDGRGRKGNVWHSPPGTGIYLSALLYPGPHLYRGLPMTLWASLAVLEAIRDAAGLDLELKWPNDIYWGSRKKVGGVMAVVKKPPGLPEPVAVLGIGINVADPPGGWPPEIAERAASLAGVAGRAVPRQRLVIALLLRLGEMYAIARTGEREQLLDEVRRRANFFGRRVRVRTGSETYTAEIEDLDPNGVLILTRDGSGETIRLMSGEIELLEEKP